MQPPVRTSVDLAAFPDLVVIYLGFRVRAWRGIASVLRIGKGLDAIQRDPPEGLLLHESVFFSLRHVGMRQYWRDLASLERFTRSDPHKSWWRQFGRDAGGAGFWHETYRRAGGMEAIYIDMPPIGLGRVAPARPPVGPFLSARERLEA